MAGNKKNELLQAVEILELPEKFNLKQVKNQYRGLMKKWHPDKNKNSKQHNDKSQEILESYKTLINYIENYTFNISEIEKNNPMTADEWFKNKYNNDPIWGNNE